MLKLENGYKRAYQCAHGSLFFEKNNDCKHLSAYGLRSGQINQQLKIFYNKSSFQGFL